MDLTPTIAPVSASIAWILPVPQAVTAAAIHHEKWGELDQTKGWDLAEIDTRWWHGRQPTAAVRDRASWFVRSRLATAVTADAHSLISLRPGGLPSLAAAGVCVAAIELRRHTDGVDLDAVCLHLNLDGDAQQRPDLVAQLLRRPGRAWHLAGPDVDRNAFLHDVEQLLGDHGLVAKLTQGGYLYCGKGSRSEVRPQILTHLILNGEVPPPPLLQDYQNWDVHQQWAYALASGANAELYFRLPPDRREAAEASTTWLGHTMIRSEQDGAAFISTREVDRPSVENVDTQLLVHGRFLDLTVLAMRQQFFLERHANELVETARTFGGADEHDDLGEVIGHEERLLRFRNRLWFTGVPSRPEGTAVLRLLQSQYGSPELLDDIAGEQADMVRILELRDSRRRRIAGERAEESRRQQTELTQRQQDEQQRTRQVVETGVALLTPPAVLSGLAALLVDPSWRLFLGTFLVSLTVVVLALLFLRSRRS